MSNNTHQHRNSRNRRSTSCHERIKDVEDIDRRYRWQLLVVFDGLEGDLFSEESEEEDGGVSWEQVEESW